MGRFEGRVVLVTGGGSGIGRDAAIAFAAEGAKVVVAGRREAAGQETVARITKAGGTAQFIRADVSREADVKALVEGTVQAFGALHVAFNNAGSEGTPRPLAEATEADYAEVFDANVKSVFLSLKHEIPAIIASGGGAIVNNASIAGSIGLPGAGLYVASKHAVLGLTRNAALEAAQLGVRVNAVSPGAVQTDMLERFTGGADEAKSWMASRHPVGRVGTGAEIAAAVLFLASPAATFVTGIDLPVDGGYLAQ